MPHSPTYESFRAEAAYALERVRYYQARGDAASLDRWHYAWSGAEDAAAAELTERGGGARLLRRRHTAPLRPLPPEQAPPAPVAATFAPSPPTPAPMPPDPLAAAIERHARIAAALRAEGPNPFPDEIKEEEWSCELAAYHFTGPLESTLLQEAEAAIEALTEMLPAQVDDYPAGPVDPTQAACFLIYAESLADLTEEELHTDLRTTLAAARQDTAALIRAELARRASGIPVLPPVCFPAADR